MSLRAGQLERTRSAIIAAAVDFFLSDENPGDFTMQAIADRAGVSHRTLYRHFEDRQALLDATAQHLDTMIDSTQYDDPVGLSFDDWVRSIPALIAFGVARRDALARGIAFSLTTGVWRSDRDERYWQSFRTRFPHLDEDTARQDFAMIRHTLGASSAVLIGERFDLTPEKLSAGMARAIDTLVDSIAARDAAARDDQASNRRR